MGEVNPRAAPGVLTIDLDAIRANWCALRDRAGTASCAGVVKADAYGLGAHRVASALVHAGCRQFFVAHLAEGVSLRATVPAEIDIFVLHGCAAHTEADFVAHSLIPVLNSLHQVDLWSRHAAVLGKQLPAALQVDTGMSRMGLPELELEQLLRNRSRWSAIDIRLFMSHLACADEPSHPLNEAQLARFARLRSAWPGVSASLANSSGIFLGKPYLHQLVRPGAALYGIAPMAGATNPMRPVVRLQARVVQVRTVSAGTTVGYAAGWLAERESRIATISTGYADGFLRSAGNRARVWIDGQAMPVVGRVSMDSITVDASDIAQQRLPPGTLVDLINDQFTVDDVAACAQTIGYEVLTGLGRRYVRDYVDAGTNSTLPSKATP
jgi:alanine racemase